MTRQTTRMGVDVEDAAQRYWDEATGRGGFANHVEHAWLALKIAASDADSRATDLDNAWRKFEDVRAELSALRQRCKELAAKLNRYAQTPGYRPKVSGFGGGTNEQAKLVYSVRDELADMSGQSTVR